MPGRATKFFDEWLNTPTAVVVVLAVVLAVNGLLLYRQPSTPTTFAPPAPPSGTSAASPGATVPAGEPEEPSPKAPVASEAPEEPETPPSPRDLGEPSRGCDGDREECAREFVAGRTPEANYIGGDLGQYEEIPYFEETPYFEEVLYFEDPTLGVCEYTLQEYEVIDGITYAVLIVGPGTFDGEGVSKCVP